MWEYAVEKISIYGCKGCSTEVRIIVGSILEERSIIRNLCFLLCEIVQLLNHEKVHITVQSNLNNEYLKLFMKISASTKCEFSILPPIEFFIYAPSPYLETKQVCLWGFLFEWKYLTHWEACLRVSYKFMLFVVQVTGGSESKWGCWELSSLYSHGKRLGYLF